MVFHWSEGTWQINSTYRGKEFNIRIVRLRNTSPNFIANIQIDGKQTLLSVIPDCDINNVGRDASEAVQHYIDTNL